MAQNMTDYVATRRGFRLEVPRVFNAARDIVDARAAAEPGKTAVVAVDPSGERPRRISFADLAHASDRAANFLAAHGVRKGDRVFVMLPRVPAWHEVLLGCVKLGAIPMPGTTLLTSKDIEYRVSKAEASVAVTDADGLPRVAEASERCSSLTSLITIGEDVPDGWLGWRAGLDLAADEPPDVEPTLADDPLLIYFTSGTTGFPKMVLHTQASYGIGHEITARFWQDLGPGDLHWTVSDTGWAKAAWGKLFGQWTMGAAVFLWDLRGKPDFERMLRLIGEHGVTTFCAPPTVFRAFVQFDLAGFDLRSLRHVVLGGRAAEPRGHRALARWHRAARSTTATGRPRP